MLGMLKHPEELGLVSGNKSQNQIVAVSLPLCESAMGTPSQEA